MKTTCGNCNTEYNTKNSNKKQLDNMAIMGMNHNLLIPICPNCDYMEFSKGFVGETND